MSLQPFTEPLTLSRVTGASAVDEETGIMPAITRVDTAISGTIQPLSGNDQSILPEGYRADEARVLYSTASVKTVSQYDATEADRIVLDSITYQAQTVFPRRPRSLIPHTKTLLLRMREQ